LAEVLMPEAMTRFVCNQKGCCCQGWGVAMEVDDVLRIVDALDQDRWRDLLDGARVLRERGSNKVVALDLAKKAPGGRCTFLEEGDLCELHRRFGPTMLPRVCRNFPSVTYALGDSRRMGWDPICPEVLERLDEGDAPYPIVALTPEPGSELAFRAESAREIPRPGIAGRSLEPAEVAAAEAQILALLDDPTWSALDHLATINEALAGALDGEALTLEPGPAPPAFEDFFDLCVSAHDGPSLRHLFKSYRRFVHALPLPVDDAPLREHLRYDPAWRDALNPRAPGIQPLLRRYLAHRFFSAFERSPATDQLTFNYGSVNHTLGTAFRYALGLSRWLERAPDRAVMKIAIGAAEFLFRSLNLPVASMPWFGLREPADPGAEERTPVPEHGREPVAG